MNSISVKCLFMKLGYEFNIGKMLIYETGL